MTRGIITPPPLSQSAQFATFCVLACSTSLSSLDDNRIWRNSGEWKKDVQYSLSLTRWRKHKESPRSSKIGLIFGKNHQTHLIVQPCIFYGIAFVYYWSKHPVRHLASVDNLYDSSHAHFTSPTAGLSCTSTTGATSVTLALTFTPCSMCLFFFHARHQILFVHNTTKWKNAEGTAVVDSNIIQLDIVSKCIRIKRHITRQFHTTPLATLHQTRTYGEMQQYVNQIRARVEYLRDACVGR